MTFVARLLGSLAAFIAMAATARAQAPDEAQRADRRVKSTHASSPSTRPSKAGRRRQMAEYLADRFRAAGFPAEDVHVVAACGKQPALVVRYRGDGSGGRPILLLAHMDVVPALRTIGSAIRSRWWRRTVSFSVAAAIDNKSASRTSLRPCSRLRAERFRSNARSDRRGSRGDEETSGADHCRACCAITATAGRRGVRAQFRRRRRRAERRDRRTAGLRRCKPRRRPTPVSPVDGAQSRRPLLFAARRQRDLRSRRRDRRACAPTNSQ